jgi:hypothetical protein
VFGIGWFMGCCVRGANDLPNANSCLMDLPLAFAFAFDLAFLRIEPLPLTLLLDAG